MSKKVKNDVEMDEELCEGCGKDHTSSKKMKTESSSKSKRMAMQDEYDMEDGENEEVKEETKDMEEVEEGYSKSKISEEEMEDEEEMDTEDEGEMEDEEEMEESKSMKESIDNLFEGQNLSEEFKLQVSTLFEAAVNDRVKLIESKLADKFTQLLESEVEDIANDLTEKVDSYLNYVVSEWMEENKLAVERGIRTDVAESFISGLKDLFTEHNIMVPEGQTDLLDETASNLEKVTEQLNKQIKKTVDLTEELKKYQRAEIFAEATDGLSSVQVDKLRSLAENMEYSDNQEFKAKLNILKENYSKTVAPKATVASIQVEDTNEVQTLNESTSNEISAYLQAMLRKNK